MMKRVSVYNKSLNFSYVFLGIFFIFYEILSSIFSYLPLFYGFFFCYMFMLLEEREKTLLKLDFRWYFSLFFLLFADITHDFFPFSSWIAFFIFYYALAGWIKTNLKMSSTTPIVFVFCAYLFVAILFLYVLKLCLLLCFLKVRFNENAFCCGFYLSFLCAFVK